VKNDEKDENDERKDENREIDRLREKFVI